jgi:hypothetical protein
MFFTSSSVNTGFRHSYPCGRDPESMGNTTNFTSVVWYDSVAVSCHHVVAAAKVCSNI